MGSVRELRGRIKSIGNIAKITKAMEMVASMKLRRVQARAVALRPYTEAIREMVEHLTAAGKSASEPLFLGRGTVKTVGVFLVTSDRGLCGAYNANLIGRLPRFLAEAKKKWPDAKARFFCYGRKGAGHLRRRGYDVGRVFDDPPLDRMDLDAARKASAALLEAFTTGGVDEMYLAYTRFASASRFEPTFEPLLPVTGIRAGGAEAQAAADAAPPAPAGDTMLEPDAGAIFTRLLPKYLETAVFDAMLQSLTSEHAARRIAMKGATDAAGRMNKHLRKVYNRARQEKITKELMDLVGGAAAVS